VVCYADGAALPPALQRFRSSLKATWLYLNGTELEIIFVGVGALHPAAHMLGGTDPAAAADMLAKTIQAVLLSRWFAGEAVETGTTSGDCDAATRDLLLAAAKAVLPDVLRGINEGKLNHKNEPIKTVRKKVVVEAQAKADAAKLQRGW
jgi:hypothetical protein